MPLKCPPNSALLRRNSISNFQFLTQKPSTLSVATIIPFVLKVVPNAVTLSAILRPRVYIISLSMFRFLPVLHCSSILCSDARRFNFRRPVVVCLTRHRRPAAWSMNVCRGGGWLVDPKKVNSRF